jgi:CobQ-like glutamine amidotransferase family enzyme
LQTATIIITMKLLRSALVSIGAVNLSTRCLAQTCQDIVAGGGKARKQEIVSGGGKARKLEFLKEEASGDIYGIVNGTEVRHRAAVRLFD